MYRFGILGSNIYLKDMQAISGKWTSTLLYRSIYLSIHPSIHPQLLPFHPFTTLPKFLDSLNLLGHSRWGKAVSSEVATLAPINLRQILTRKRSSWPVRVQNSKGGSWPLNLNGNKIVFQIRSFSRCYASYRRVSWVVKAHRKTKTWCAPSLIHWCVLGPSKNNLKKNQRIHVWYIYPHLVDFTVNLGKYIYHTWIRMGNNIFPPFPVFWRHLSFQKPLRFAMRNLWREIFWVSTAGSLNFHSPKLRLKTSPPSLCNGKC